MGTAKYFVATTALKEFWDTSRPLVFIGEWCKRYSQRTDWESLAAVTMEYDVPQPRAFEIIQYLDGVYERLLPVLAAKLNEIHGVKFSDRYWRIVLGAWPFYFLHAVHDKYEQIQRLRREYPDFTTVVLADSCFVIPEDTLSFMGYSYGDAYNLQLYSQIFKQLGYALPARMMTVCRDPEFERNFYSRSGKNFKRAVRRGLAGLARLGTTKNQVLFKDVYFSPAAAVKLIVRTGGKFWPYMTAAVPAVDVPVDPKMRELIRCGIFGENEYEKMLLGLIADGMPKSMVERFAVNRGRVLQQGIPAPKAVMSAVAWYIDEAFKIFSAEAAEKGAKLVGVQHGGNYGSLQYYLQEEYELGITDKFFSWGWKRDDCRAEVVPAPATKLISRINPRNPEGQSDILYITSFWPRFVSQYPLTADLWKDYLSQQTEFIAGLTGSAREALVVRPHRAECGLDFRARFVDIRPAVKVESWGRPFSQRNYRMLVCDHPYYSTTIIESLANNRPTILFGNPDFAAHRLNESARPYWDGLRAAGILSDSPQEAAQNLMAVFDRVEEWWQEPQRQEAVRMFLSKFGRTADDWLNVWSREITAILER